MCALAGPRNTITIRFYRPDEVTSELGVLINIDNEDFFALDVEIFVVCSCPVLFEGVAFWCLPPETLDVFLRVTSERP